MVFCYKDFPHFIASVFLSAKMVSVNGSAADFLSNGLSGGSNPFEAHAVSPGADHFVNSKEKPAKCYKIVARYMHARLRTGTDVMIFLFRRKMWRKYWRFLLVFAKIRSLHWYLSKTPFFAPKDVKNSRKL
jgi:hypothetical protein